MTAIEYAQSLSRQYKRIYMRLYNQPQSLPIRERCKNFAEAKVYEIVAEEMDGLIDLMKQEEKARRCGNTGEPARDDGLNPHHPEE